MTVDDLGPGDATTIDGDTFGYPYDSLNDVPPGDYFVQAVLHRYDNVELGNGKVVSLPPGSWRGSAMGALSRESLQ